MTRLAIVSDTHIDPWREFAVPGKRGLSTRLYHTVSVLAEIRAYCIEHSIHHLLHGGDLFHRRAVVGTPAWTLVVAELAKLREAGVVLWMVDGNHDQANRTGTVHALQALDSAGLAWTPKRHASGTLLQAGSDAIALAAVSYCDGRKLFEERVERAYREARQRSKEAPCIALLHHGFIGARVGAGLEYVVREAIPGSALAGYDFARAFSGHYHARQAIDGAKAQYIGSPMEFVRGESGQPKGFLVYDVASDDVEVVPIIRPRFIKLTQPQIAAEDFSQVRGNYVDVVFSELPKPWLKYSEWLVKEHGAVAAKPVAIRPERRMQSPRLALDLSASDRQMLIRFLNYRKRDTRGMDRRELLRLGLELLNQVE